MSGLKSALTRLDGIWVVFNIILTSTGTCDNLWCLDGVLRGQFSGSSRGKVQAVAGFVTRHRPPGRFGGWGWISRGGYPLKGTIGHDWVRLGTIGYDLPGWSARPWWLAGWQLPGPATTQAEGCQRTVVISTQPESISRRAGGVKWGRSLASRKVRGWPRPGKRFGLERFNFAIHGRVSLLFFSFHPIRLEAGLFYRLIGSGGDCGSEQSTLGWTFQPCGSRW